MTTNCEPLNIESESMTIEVKRRIADQAAELVKTNVPQRQLELVGELAASLGDLLHRLATCCRRSRGNPYVYS